MRVLTLCAVVLFAGAAVGQTPAIPGYVPGYGPYVPLITTPQISLQTVSPNPVGARNATYGLVAGARNSTFETIPNGNTNSVFTEAVWYQGGGAPLISEPEVSLEVRGIRGGEYLEHHGRVMERGAVGEARAAAASHAWTYFASMEETASPVEASAAAKTGRRATRTITNQDIDLENQKTGTVHYDGQTRKLQ
jgi:hypothetical protein